MYTLNNYHIIFHLHNLNDVFYIRSVVCENSKLYLQEINKVYSFNETINDVDIFYNCGDLYDRLLNDLNYKKFKNIELIKKCKGIWQIESKERDIINWYSSIYIPYINSKISMYLEDIDDNYYKIDNIDWKSSDFTKYIKHDFVGVGDYVKNGVIYTLLNCEQMNGFVITHNHLLALVKEYITNKYIDLIAIISPYKSFPVTDDNILIITENLRGICIDKNELVESDIIKIFNYLNISIGDLIEIARDKKFIKIFDDDRKFYNDITEFGLFKSNYMYLDTTDIPNYNGDIEDVFKCSEECNKQFKKQAENNELILKKNVLSTTVENESFKTNIYKNIITNSFISYDEILTSLVELQLLSEYTYKSEYMKNMIDNIHTIPQSTLNELKELINIIENGIDKPKESTITQKTLTENYINKYKNDNIETLASKVIDNIINYLVEEKLEIINKNDIGKDLVDLGVKKIRKSNGFVYGLEDSKHSEKNTSETQSQAFTIDKNKVTKNSNQIRSEPPITINTDLLHFSIPSKFIIPNEI